MGFHLACGVGDFADGRRAQQLPSDGPIGRSGKDQTEEPHD